MGYLVLWVGAVVLGAYMAAIGISLKSRKYWILLALYNVAYVAGLLAGASVRVNP